jgi:hypothetical protein
MWPSPTIRPCGSETGEAQSAKSCRVTRSFRLVATIVFEDYLVQQICTMTKALAYLAAFALCVATRAYSQSSDHIAMNNKSCPPWGKTPSGGKISKTSDAGLRNLAKRHLPGGTSPTSVEVAEFKTLQQDIDALTHADAATKKTAFTPTRTLLQQLSTSHSTLSEGDLVGVSGFLHRAENGSAAETVNCGGADGRDIHVNINATKSGTTFDEWNGDCR